MNASDGDFVYSTLIAHHQDPATASRALRIHSAEALRNAAEVIVAENDRKLWATKPGEHWAADVLRRMADAAAAVPVPDETAGRMSPQQCAKGIHADWAVDSELEHTCPWCELAKYVGAEPTIAEEMQYLSRCLDAVRDVCDATEKQATRWEHPLPVPEWVAQVREAASGERPDNPELAELRELKRRVTEQLEDFEEGLEEDPEAPAVAHNMTQLLARAVRGESR